VIIGYPEAESRLSDVALNWMVEDLIECVPSIQINENVLSRASDPLGLQDCEDAKRHCQKRQTYCRFSFDVEQHMVWHLDAMQAIVYCNS